MDEKFQICRHPKNFSSYFFLVRHLRSAEPPGMKGVPYGEDITSAATPSSWNGDGSGPPLAQRLRQEIADAKPSARHARSDRCDCPVSRGIAATPDPDFDELRRPIGPGAARRCRVDGGGVSPYVRRACSCRGAASSVAVDFRASGNGPDDARGGGRGDVTGRDMARPRKRARVDARGSDGFDVGFRSVRRCRAGVDCRTLRRRRGRARRDGASQGRFGDCFVRAHASADHGDGGSGFGSGGLGSALGRAYAASIAGGAIAQGTNTQGTNTRGTNTRGTNTRGRNTRGAISRGAIAGHAVRRPTGDHAG